MTENAYKFEIPKHHKSIIKVIGVGGGGSNAVNHMFSQGIQDVEFVVCNTDAQALKSSPVPNKLQIGVNLTGGLGAGANPNKGKDAALESKEDIREMLSHDTKMVFVTAGMGGGTGTGAAPVIARIAREMDILTVGIVTAPFSFEGRKKMEAAEEGIAELKANCDTVLVILNDKLLEIYDNLTISNAFAQADNVLTTGAKGIAEIITVPGLVNVDFEDVKTVMKGAGAAVMGSARTEGEGRALRAAEEALASPLLNNTDILGAQRILLSIISGEQAELKIKEFGEITAFIQERAGDDAEVIFGHGIDPNLGENISVTVIATGFDQSGYKENNIKKENEKRIYDLESNRQISLFNGEQERKDETPKPREYSASDEPRRRNEDNSSSMGGGSSRGYAFTGGSNFDDGGDDFDTPDNAGDDDMFIRGLDDYEIEHRDPNQQPPDPMEHKKEQMREKAKQRIEKLKNMRQSGEVKNLDEYKSMLETPAYKRKNVKLKDVPHSSEKNVSRYNLNDDNQILGNNKFLHDNVD